MSNLWLKWFMVVLIGCTVPDTIAFGKVKKPYSWKIKAVEFRNNRIFSDYQLRRVMVSKPSRLFHSTVFKKEILEEDLRIINLFYHQNGYLEGRVTESSVLMDSSTRHVHISITINEGQQTLIEDISVLGNRTFADERLLGIIRLKSKDPFVKQRIEWATLALLRFYADRGYLEAVVEPEARIDSVTHRVLLDFRIQEGHQSIVGNIIFHGLKKTRPKVVFRELQFKEGDILNYSWLLESQRRIYLTGLFQSAFIRPVVTENRDSTRKDIRIELKENPSVELNVSVGYGSVERLRGKAEIFSKNVFGSARKVGLSAMVSFIRRSVEGSFTEPWTFGTPWRTDLILGSAYKEEPGYHFYQTGGSLTVGRSFLQRSSIMARFRLQQGRLKNVKVREIPDNLKSDIRSFELILTYDSRDNLFNATRGIFAEWSGELGGSSAQEVNGFVRLNAKLKYFYSMNPGTVFAGAVDIGWLESEGGLSGIPLSERFYAGGPNSVRGFQYQRLGPLDEHRTPLGGRLKCIWHMIEVRQKLFKMFGVVIFLDVGNVWSAPEDFRFRELRFSPGIGLRLNTPIGVGRIDVGVNIDRRAGEPHHVWSFSMGQVI